MLLFLFPYTFITDSKTVFNIYNCNFPQWLRLILMVARSFLPHCFTMQARTAFMRCWKYIQSPSLSWGPLHSHALGANPGVVSRLRCSEYELLKSSGTSTRMSPLHLLELKVFLTWPWQRLLNFFFQVSLLAEKDLNFFCPDIAGWREHLCMHPTSLLAFTPDFHTWLSPSAAPCLSVEHHWHLVIVTQSPYPYIYPFPSKSQRSDMLHL